MKGYKFYLEYPNAKAKRHATRASLGDHSGNVIATWEDPYISPRGDAVIEAFSAVYAWENSPVNFGAVSLDYLQDRCKRISEKQARAIHPALFTRLDE